MKPNNYIENGFLEKFRYSRDGRTVFLKLTSGFLRLEYYSGRKRNLLKKVSFVKSESETENATGHVLEFNLTPDKSDDRVTFIPENGISGIQWALGKAGWGHTLDLDGGDDAGREIDLDTWVDECIDDMINPCR